jgi:hypothetical protein
MVTGWGWDRIGEEEKGPQYQSMMLMAMFTVIHSIGTCTALSMYKKASPRRENNCITVAGSLPVTKKACDYSAYSCQKTSLRSAQVYIYNEEIGLRNPSPGRL